MSIPSTSTTSTVNNVVSTSNTITNGHLPTATLPLAAPNGHGGPSIHPNGAPPPQSQSWIERGSIGRKRKWTSMGFNEAEQASMERTTIGFHLALAQDQVSTLYPDPPTAFESYEDVVQRLVPYHIWQTCDEELEGQEGESEEKRKEKVDREEKEATNILERMTRINQRFVKLRTREAQHASRPVDLINIISQSTVELREELSTVQREYRRLNSIRDSMEWEARKREEIKRREDQARREQVERAQAAAVAAKTKHGQASTSTFASTSTPNTPATSRPGTPTSTAAARSSTPASTSTPGPGPVSTPTPAQSTTPTRGRGRPRGSGGLRTQVLTHSAQAQAQAHAQVTGKGSGLSTPTAPVSTAMATKSASPGPGPHSRTSTISPVPTSGPNSPDSETAPARSTRGTATPGSADSAAGSGPASRPNASTKGPVLISVPKTALPELYKYGILSSPSGQGETSGLAPATVSRQTEKGVVLSIDLGKCTPKQLVALAKVLKVEAGSAGSGGARDAVAQKAFQGARP